MCCIYDIVKDILLVDFGYREIYVFFVSDFVSLCDFIVWWKDYDKYFGFE